MMTSQDDQTSQVLTALDAAIELALAAGFTPDDIVATVIASVNPGSE